ncbi:MAG: ftsK [Alphaproteobacteria bacterium]|jgi:S-DNA-T family DNA segregation ATPase FtsK/SpoIIIE|nr:ftsK [Alphaproteobacteria bacterium]
MTLMNLPAVRKRRFFPEGAGPFLRLRLMEVLGAALLAGGLGLFLALATFDRGDPSFNVATPQVPKNIFGLKGAYAADALLQSLGLAAWLLAFVVTVWGLRLMRRHSVPRFALRLALLPLTLLLAATALSFFGGTGSNWITHAGPGGITGRELGDLMRSYSFVLGNGLSAGLLGLGFGVASLLCLVPTLAMQRDDWPLIVRLLFKFVGLLIAGIMGVLGFLWRLARRESKPSVFEQLEMLPPDLAGTLNGAPVAETLWRRLARLTRLDRLFQSEGGARSRRREPTMAREATVLAGEIETAAARLPAAIEVEDDYDDEDEATVDDPAITTIDGEGIAIAPRVITPQRKPRIGTKQAQLKLGFEKYETPPIDILAAAPKAAINLQIDEDALTQNARMLETVLSDFGVKGEIVKVRPGPVVTLYELEPAPGTKSSRIINLADDIARSMSAVSVRVATVPGRNVIGIELPNQRRETVYLRELLSTKDYEDERHNLPLILGKDIGGSPVIADLSRMPHLLIGGTTGSGKSVAINTMILSLLYRLTPERCRFIMIDPKMLELSVYADIPHLLTPVVTEPRKAIVALKWVVREMENRYRLMSQLGVRNIAGYNERVAEARRKGEVLTRTVQTGVDPDTLRATFEEQPLDLESLPFIVVIIDEMADLMLVAGKDIEGAIQRLAQMARAAGIHVIMATQRPSVDVITGTIKANFPTRISFQVTSKIDSRTILGEQGGEQLLGQGDMLYMAGGGRISRVHGPFVSDTEVEKVVKFLRSQGEPSYLNSITEESESGAGIGGMPGESGGESDDLYDQAVAIITRERKASTSFIQRHLQIGYNRAARIIERMESEGVVSPANHVGKREVLARDIDDSERLN